MAASAVSALAESRTLTAHLFADQRHAGRCLCMLCLTLLFNAPQSAILSLHRSRAYRCQVQPPCMRLAGGAEQPETAEEIVRRAQEQELAMLAEEEGTAAGQEGPAVPSCPLAAADLLRRAQEQEMSILATETREEQHSKRVRACENGQGSGDSSKRQKTTFSFHFRHGAHSAVDTEQLVRLALIEELQMLAEEARAAGADCAGSGGGAVSAAPLEAGRGPREISERTRRLLLQAHNEEMMMLEREGNAAPHARAQDFPREADWRQGRTAADAQGQGRGSSGGRAEGRGGSGGHEPLTRAAVPPLERGGGEEREAASTLMLNVSTYVASHGHMPLGKTRGEGEREGMAGKGGGEQATEKGNGEEQGEKAEDRGGDGREAGGARGGGGISGSGSGGGGKWTRPPAEPCGLCIGAREGEEEVARVSWRCETCGEALCDVCVRMHARVKLFALHVVVPL
jgi:hypothetical protein